MISGFRPSTHGLHFGNDFPAVPVRTIPFPPFGAMPIGNASGGLCGGMVFTACDFYLQGVSPPPQTGPPAPGTPLFEYLVDRLFASFNGVPGVLKYLRWMALPEERTRLSPGIVWHSLHQEWPAIQKDLDRGLPCPLGLVKVHSFNPLDLGKNHQVLAYGYEQDQPAGLLKIFVYDPNYPDADELSLCVQPAGPDGPARITYAADPRARGFFRTRYTPVSVDRLTR